MAPKEVNNAKFVTGLRKAYGIYVKGNMLQMSPIATEDVAKAYADRFNKTIPGHTVKSIKVKPTEQVIAEFERSHVESIVKRTEGPTGYQKGKSCRKLGKEHNYVKSASGKTFRCTQCGSVKGA